ncbi:MAG TPA: CehA/McbA family metallohydrolase [Solimonas sp.]
MALAACGSSSPGALVPGPAPVDPDLPRCAPGASPLAFTGSVGVGDAKTYRLQPFAVEPGTGRVELRYGWTDKPGLPSTPLTATTLDLGLWDADGYRVPAGFRGWSGSRQGRIDRDQAPVFVEAGSAERSYVPGVIEPGVWHAELGIAAVAPQGADWVLQIECKIGGSGVAIDDPVDARHVARVVPGWYHGDFHMHGFHSQPNGPEAEDFVAQSRAAQLDFLMVTDYVTGRHWRELGAMQRAHPDLLIWPGREIITYFGHANTHGETPSVIDYRHGFEDVNLAEIQRLAKQDDALFQVNHPTLFPPPLFSNFCRGCYFELGDEIDWSQVDTIEILTGPVLATADDLGLGLPLPAAIEQPFMTTAILLWEDLLRRGHKITAVSGSDSKGVEGSDADRERKGYGSSATAVYASELSRPALKAAIRAGHAYVRTRGVARSPALAFTATAADGQSGIFGDTLQVDGLSPVTLRTTVTGGGGQLLSYLRNGLTVLAVPVVGDDFTHEFALATREPLTEGPLGTFWRVEVRDLQTRTAIGNPIFLQPR